MSKGIVWEIYPFILSICISTYCVYKGGQDKIVVGDWGKGKRVGGKG